MGCRPDTAIRSGPDGGGTGAGSASPASTARATAASAADRASGPNEVIPYQCSLAPPASGTRPGRLDADQAAAGGRDPE